MHFRATLLPLLLCIVLSQTVNAQARRRTRIRTNPVQQQRPQEVEPQESDDGIDYNDEDNTPEPALQYYSASQAQDDRERVVLVASDDEYNGVYGRPTQGPRARADYSRPIAKSTTIAPRTKDPGPKETVQTIRNYSKVNDDGSFTFGYEAADGSFKEETRGTDCVVRGKYGYIDPDGNKREFTYVSGNPCDPNNPDQNDEEPEREEETNEPENVPVNFPRRPLRPAPQRPIQTTTHAPTTVFQNQYTSNSYSGEDERENVEQEQPESIQLLQQQRPRVSARPQHIPVPEEVAIRQRPRITANTTPAPLYQIQTQSGNSVSITPRPTYRAQPTQTQPPATTYRPAIQFFTQKTSPVTYAKTQSQLSVEPITKTSYTSTRKPIDFAAEFQKFQQENNVVTTTTPRPSNLKTYRPQTLQKIELPSATPNPIYEHQLVFDPATGQIDPSLFPQIAHLQQPSPAYQLNHRVQPSFLPHHQHQQQQQQFHPSPQIVTLEQLQQQNAQPIYQRPPPVPSTRSPLQFPQFSQQVYQKDHENLQVLNSQQLYAQQQEIQQHQLHQDRIEAVKRQHQQPQQAQSNHRFQLGQQQQQQQQQLRPLQQPGFFYVHNQNAPIDPFLRQNVEFH